MKIVADCFQNRTFMSAMRRFKGCSFFFFNEFPFWGVEGEFFVFFSMFPLCSNQIPNVFVKMFPISIHFFISYCVAVVVYKL